jgi:hypothetical protein
MKVAARIFALASLAFCCAVPPAFADDRGICGTVPPKPDSIAACSRIIGAPRTSTHDRTLALSFRADIARAQGDMAAAVADY